jgi:hypothetical protein
MIQSLCSKTRHNILEDLEAPGWDPLTGYGMLRVDNALIY